MHDTVLFDNRPTIPPIDGEREIVYPFLVHPPGVCFSDRLDETRKGELR